MMPVSFEQSNFVFGKPKDMTDEECTDLPVFKGQSRQEETGAVYPCIISCWKLNKEDIDRINETGIIWLNITGQGMPPVSLQTESPF